VNRRGLRACVRATVLVLVLAAGTALLVLAAVVGDTRRCQALLSAHDFASAATYHCLEAHR